MLTEKQVADEIARAKAQHGAFPKDQTRAFVLLAEEMGEVARAVAEVTRLPRLHVRRPTHRQNLREELTQVVAVACMWISNIDQEVFSDEHQHRNQTSTNSDSAGGTVGQ